MSTVKTTNLQHPSAPSPNLVLNADGSVTGGGVIVAVNHALFTGTQTNSTGSGANFAVTDLSITHTLADASNKLIISAYFGAAANSQGYGNVGIAVADDGTLIGIGDAASSRTRVGAGGRVFGLDHFGHSAPAKVLDVKLGFTAENVLAEAEVLLNG